MNLPENLNGILANLQMIKQGRDMVGTELSRQDMQDIARDSYEMAEEAIEQSAAVDRNIGRIRAGLQAAGLIGGDT